MKIENKYRENCRDQDFSKIFLFTAILVVFLLASEKLFALPPSFQNNLVRSGFDQPTSMAFLPDGRVLVAEKGGKIYFLDPQQASPSRSLYLDIPDTDRYAERGLLDIVVDPEFTNKPFIYVAYHRKSDPRLYISRFNHEGDLADLSSEFVVWNDPNPLQNNNHYGGGLSFGPDGNLYLATGDQFIGLDAQDLTKAGGKIIRVAPDGTIPADNPFNDGPGGNLNEIWAYGLRNPFRVRWDIPVTGRVGPRLFIGEVGGNFDESNEDVHIGRKGANYGWPFCEGFDCVPVSSEYDPPFFTHEHNEYPGTHPGTAIVGGIVYRGGQFPSEYDGAYFYGDYAQRYIRYLTIDNNGAVLVDNIFEPNETDAGLVVDLKQGPDGALYYLQYASLDNQSNSGAMRRISFNDGNQAPLITSATADVVSGNVSLRVIFNGAATDNENDPLQYLWLFGDGTQATGANVTHDYLQAGSFQARLQVSDNNKTTTLEQPIIISVGSAPNVTIDEPKDGSFFRAGETINFSATASDQGVLTDNSYKWTALFMHNEHTHPELGPVSGSSGSLHTPIAGHSFNTDTGFQLTVEVTDADGLSTNKTVNIFPEKVDISFVSQPSGIPFFIDGTINRMPIVYDTAIDFKHVITVPQTACLNNTHYSFDNWSNGAAGSAIYSVPAQNATLTATYTAGGPCDANSNVSPLAFSDEGTLKKNAKLEIPVLENDTDPDGALNKSSVVVVQPPQHGSVTVNTNTGAIFYNHSGSTEASSDNFTYRVLDNTSAVSNEATVYLKLTETNTKTSNSCGMSLALDGSDDWVNIPNLELTGDFTIESWIKLAPGIDSRDALIGQEGAGPDINFYAGKARLFVESDKVIANTPIHSDIWTHLAITRSGSNLSMYINGLLDAVGVWNGTLPVKALGRGNRSQLGFLKGELDEVRLWNVARTGKEIGLNFDRSLASDSPGLLAYWTFNESGQEINDSSGYSKHGTLGASSSVFNDDPNRSTSAAPIKENCVEEKLSPLKKDNKTLMSKEFLQRGKQI